MRNVRDTRAGFFAFLLRFLRKSTFVGESIRDTMPTQGVLGAEGVFDAHVVLGNIQQLSLHINLIT